MSEYYRMSPYSNRILVVTTDAYGMTITSLPVDEVPRGAVINPPEQFPLLFLARTARVIDGVYAEFLQEILGNG